MINICSGNIDEIEKRRIGNIDNELIGNTKIIVILKILERGY